MTSLSNLLRGAVEHHAGDSGLSPRQVELRADFEARLPERLAEIKGRWKTLLVIHRNAYLAHRDLAKLDALPEMTYLDIRAAIDLAQTYYASSAQTYLNQEKKQYWRLMQYESEPEGFLKWCRLDDYERHVREDDQGGWRLPWSLAMIPAICAREGTGGYVRASVGEGA